MNYFIEGIQGSGKTTMLEKMTQDNPKLKAYREGDFSPVELAWCAYVSHSQYEIIIKKYANLAGEIKKNTVKEGEMYIITYTRIITDIPDFHKELEQYEIYNGLKSKAEFEEIVLSRFTSWSEDNQLFECSIFQNIIENQILYLQMNDDEIVDFYRRVKDTLKGKKYKIIYLSVDNVREAEEIIKKERSDEAGNEMWFPVMIKYLEGAPFFKAHGYIGMEIMELILDTVCSKRKTIRIAGDDKPLEVVKSRFMKLDYSHISYVLSCLKENSTQVRNIKQYLLAALYNAPLTISNYYQAMYNNDHANGLV